jgi:hypothetical protein
MMTLSKPVAGCGRLRIVDPGEQDSAVQDDRHRLIFTCCHPAVSTHAQVALTLRLLGGLSTNQVASAFLVTEPTMARRLVRAKHKIKAARIPYRVPAAHELSDRLRPVLAVAYLVYNAGLTSPAEPDLCSEAIRLGRHHAAAAAYQRAAAMAPTHAEREFLRLGGRALREATRWRRACSRRASPSWRSVSGLTPRRPGPPATRLGPAPSPCATPRRRRTARPGRSGRRGSPAPLRR